MRAVKLGFGQRWSGVRLRAPAAREQGMTALGKVGLGGVFALAASACLATPARREYDDVIRLESAAPRPSAAAGADERGLEQEARLDVILRIAATRNPDLAEAHERVRAGAERVLASGRLPDPELKYEQWGVPLARPYALGSADMLMLGVRQSFPARGVRGAEARQAAEEARMGVDAERARRLDLARQVQRTFFDYYAADRERSLHLEHAELTRQIAELAKAAYAAGRGSQADVLRAILALTAVHNDVTAMGSRLETSRALLNTLMGREPDAPLGPPRDLVASHLALDATALTRQVEQASPELSSARRALRRDDAALDAAQRAASWPTFMVGVDYQFSPRDRMHAYGAMVSMSLPWLSSRHDDEVRQAEHTISADLHAYESALNTARYQVREALVEYRAAVASYDLIDRELGRQADQALEAAQTAYASGQGSAAGILDAARSVLDTRIARLRALALVQSSLADLERATGRPLQGATP